MMHMMCEAIKVALPARDKDDLLFKLFFGKRRGPFNRGDVIGFKDWCSSNSMVVTQAWWRLLDTDQVTWDNIGTNLRLR